jgi:hypothetical protein
VTHTSRQAAAGAEAQELTARIGRIVESVIARKAEEAERDFTHVLGRVRELVLRKQSMKGTKSETRDLIGELVFSRFRRSFRTFLHSPEAREEIRVAEWVLGAVAGSSTLQELAVAVDRAILEGVGPRDFSFAGRSDFISLEEVMQMLGAGKHTGRLSIEKQDNRLDLYIQRGQITFLDPHHLVRRVMPGQSPMQYREISSEQLQLAESRRAQDGMPVLLALADAGAFKDLDLRSTMRQLGGEVLLDFLRDQDKSNFHYTRLDELPEFAVEYDLRLGITPVLLEISKKLDDWRTLVSVFPDMHQPIEPMPDMLARISGLNLGVLEIKLLTMINGENSPVALTEMTGLPLTEVYQHLVAFAREGAVVVPGGAERLEELTLSVEESLQEAFEALDENDDELALSSALDKVLGDEDGDSGFSLDFLKTSDE